MADLDINIPDFITLVSSQVKEAVQRFKDTGEAPLLYLNGLQLQIAFTAEESSDKEGKIELKPYIFSLGAGKKESQGQQVVHTVVLNLSASLVQEPLPPFNGSELEDTDFSLLFEVIRQLQTSLPTNSIYAGPGTEFVPPFIVQWRNLSFQIEIRKRLARQLIENCERLNSLEDLKRLSGGSIEDLVFVPLGTQPQQQGFAPPPVAFQ